jgi:hypothetical protein
MSDDSKLSIVELARKRYEIGLDYYSQSRSFSDDDYRFVMGDGDNLNQWDKIKRGGLDNNDGKVMLTVNISAQHNYQIINNFRQGIPTGKVIPVSQGADQDSAKMMEGWLRSIKSRANSDDCTIKAIEWMVNYGEGYSWIVTDYESDDSFNQVIKEYPIKNPRDVIIDPFCKDVDRSDAEWGFVLQELPKSEADKYGVDPMSWESDHPWVTKDSFILCHYYYCEYTKDALEMYEDGTSGYKSQNKDKKLPVRTRKADRKQWHHCKLVGGEDEPVENEKWLGDYLPIIQFIGTEYIIDGVCYRKGLTRDTKDMCRMHNYALSSAVEAIALQPKVPYILPDGAIGQYQNLWENANTGNVPFLPYVEYDSQGRQHTRPYREQQPLAPTAQLQMLEVATNEIKAASGQQNANFGIRSNETSGVAIERQKAQGETATYHFVSYVNDAIKYREKVLVDLAPKVYTERQVVKILGLDGSEENAMKAPGSGVPYQKVQDQPDISHLFDPTIGRYDVDVSTGASFQTQRQEGAQVITEMVRANPVLMQTHGDIIFSSYDFPGSDDMADRSRKTLPPQLQPEGEQQDIPPQVQAQLQELQQQAQEQEAALQGAVAHVKQLEDELSKQDLETRKVKADAIGHDIQAREYRSMLTIQSAEHKLMAKAMPEDMHNEEEYKPEMDEILYKVEETAINQEKILELLSKIIPEQMQ